MKVEDAYSSIEDSFSRNLFSVGFRGYVPFEWYIACVIRWNLEIPHLLPSYLLTLNVASL